MQADTRRRFYKRLFVLCKFIKCEQDVYMKPRTDVVMSDIIQKIKDVFPFSMGEEELCGDTCSHGCALKLLDYLYMEITEWEQRLENGYIPSFKDIQKLTKTSKKIYKVLEKNNLVAGYS